MAPLPTWDVDELAVFDFFDALGLDALSLNHLFMAMGVVAVLVLVLVWVWGWVTHASLHCGMGSDSDDITVRQLRLGDDESVVQIVDAGPRWTVMRVQVVHEYGGGQRVKE